MVRRASHWTGFYMLGTFSMIELKKVSDIGSLHMFCCCKPGELRNSCFTHTFSFIMDVY